MQQQQPAWASLPLELWQQVAKCTSAYHRKRQAGLHAWLLHDDALITTAATLSCVCTGLRKAFQGTRAGSLWQDISFSAPSWRESTEGRARHSCANRCASGEV